MSRLTTEREKRGLTKSELARRSGIGLPEICRLESGKIFPYPGWRRRLAAALEVSEDELFPEVAEK